MANSYSGMNNYNIDRDEWEYKRRAMEEMMRAKQNYQASAEVPQATPVPKPVPHLNKKLLLTKG